MSMLAADPALRERLGSEGRRRFTEQFRHETMTARTRELYERLLSQRTKIDRGQIKAPSPA